MKKLLFILCILGYTATAQEEIRVPEQEPAKNWTVGGVDIQADTTINYLQVEYTIYASIRYIAVNYGQRNSSFYAYGKKSQIRDKWYRKVKFNKHHKSRLKFKNI